jgi:uracil-DNA glycosylase
LKLITEKSWNEVLAGEFKQEYFTKLYSFIQERAETETIYPAEENIFKAFEITPLNKVKVVILGQDPYHGPFQANGLSFSVNKGVKFPPSLKNIFKELEDDLGIKNLHNGDLSAWAKQGVLLLNATLTVEATKAGSHQKKGWEQFTDKVIEVIANQCEGVVFVLWGSYAQKKGQHIDRAKHCVIETAHPSPLSVYRGFYGSKPFSTINAYLGQQGKTPIDWSLE